MTQLGVQGILVLDTRKGGPAAKVRYRLQTSANFHMIFEQFGSIQFQWGINSLR